MPLHATTAGDVRRGDRLGDGTVVVGLHVRPDGRIAIAYKRRSWRSRKVRIFAPDEPVTVVRFL